MDNKEFLKVSGGKPKPCQLISKFFKRSLKIQNTKYKIQNTKYKIHFYEVRKRLNLFESLILPPVLK